MVRHPNCNGEHPCCEARPGPWAAPQCPLCWQALNDPDRIQGLQGRAARAASAALPILPLPRPQWPWRARAVSWFRRPADRGVGDTIARLLGRAGEVSKRVYRWLSGRECACGSRQARLNLLFPYPSPARPS